ncbi:MAG: type I-C CRISPR-associated protein Cas8c/Csd1 [Bryobacteraceae bacterium]
MILQALAEYYDRKAADLDPANRLAPEGFELKEVPFVLELDREGRLIQIEDTREIQGKRKIGKSFLVPQSVKRASGIAANLLWDTAEYVIGIDTRGKPERVAEQHEAFKRHLKDTFGTFQDPGLVAVARFLERMRLSDLESRREWNEIRETNPNLSFRFQGDVGLVCHRAAVLEAIQIRSGEAGLRGLCLVSGKTGEIERLHPAIKCVWGAQLSGGNIVSFNLEAFNSYGKSQGANAPVGKRAAFAYTTALNHLLRKDSPQRVQVGDASTVFWAERQSALETAVGDIFGEPPNDDPDRNVRAVRSLYRSVATGGFVTDNDTARFYVLGLAPNAARIAIRFWHVSTVAVLARHLRQHFDDLEIARPSWASPHPSLFRLLTSIAVQGKADNIPPNLGGDLMRSILSGLPYPSTLLHAAVRRCRAEQARRDQRSGKALANVTPERAALIKAYINRETRSRHSDLKENLKVSLDPNNPDLGYRLGRLFAALERIQEDANPGINATIRDRFYGAASSAPVTVFPNLMRLKNHHLAKIENRGRVVNFEKLLGEIMSEIDDFPAILPLADQGRFTIGYYHQQQAFYTKFDPASKGA